MPIPARLRLLVVDDEKDLADVLGLLVEALGIDVRVAYGGRDAIDAVAQWSPHVVFMDIRMPDLDGYQTTQAIRALPGQGPLQIFAVSGWVGDPHQMEDNAHLFAGYLAKPLSMESIRRTLKHVASHPARCR